MPNNTFSGNPRVEWLVDSTGADRDMRLLDNFSYTDPDGRVWLAPAGAVINGASIPEGLWSVVGSPYTGDYRRASIVHDVACDSPNVNRKEADVMFYYACMAGGCGKRQARILYAGVRIGAWSSISLPFIATHKSFDALETDPQASTDRFLRDKLAEVTQKFDKLPDNASIEAIDAAIASVVTIPGGQTPSVVGNFSPAPTRIDEAFLAQGLQNLERLSQAEYHKDLVSLLNGSDEGLELKQLGRLAGITIKEPFARPRLSAVAFAHTQTHAFRTWDLVDDQGAFDSKRDSWQYQLLQTVASDPRQSVYDVAAKAQGERGFFGLVAEHICASSKKSDNPLRGELEGLLKKLGVKEIPFTRDTIVSSVAVQVANLLIAYVPLLANVSATLLAAVVTILLRWGLEAFCKWQGSANAGDVERN